LIERLNAGLWCEGRFTRRLTLLSAPAGFGKTTLLSAWVAGSQLPVAWVSLDQEDNAPPRFLTYLIAALQTIRKGVGQGLLGALRSPQPPPLNSVLVALANEISALDRGWILVLDDYHVIESAQTHRLLNALLYALPSQMHLVISTRTDPPLPLARFRARGELLELRQADLRFTREEVGAFLDRVADLSLSPDDVDALTARTEGWVAGLQLAALSMQQRDDPSGFVRAFTGSHRFVIDYLAGEVFAQQGPDLQAFLLQTAILDRMTAPLCEAVCSGFAETHSNRQDGQSTLEMLERENVFVVPLDDDRRWYRYHHLFRDMLRQRLLRTVEGPRVATLHLRASRWFEEEGFVVSAVDHAIAAADLSRATALIDDHAGRLWATGEQATLLRWLDTLPAEGLRARPQLCIIYALVLFAAGRSDESATFLDAAQQALDTPSDREQISLRGVLDAARAFVAFSRGDLPEIVRFSRRALDRLPQDDLLWRSIATYTLGLAQRLSGDLPAAERTLEDAVRLGTATDNHYVALVARLNLARLQAQRGHLRRADEMLRHAIGAAEAMGMDQLPVTGLLSIELGSILVEWNALDEAVALLEKGAELIARGEDVTAMQMGHAFMARALFAQGDVDGVQDLVRRMEYLAEETAMSGWIQYWIVALRLRVYLARDDLASAARLAEEIGLSIDEAPTYVREMAYSPLIQLYIAQGRPEATMGLLARLLQAAEDAGRWGRVIATLALRASALTVQGDVDAALADLARALSLAEAEGYVRVFVEQGPAMAHLLRRAATRGVAPEVASRLLAEFDLATEDAYPEEQPLIEPLSERELEVLRFLETDLTMEEIGQELFIARSTVRSHVKSVYGKMNVHSRRDAVRRARALGLLS
jgi:LuxR family maltose regulon positive regulatory protein